MSSEFTMNSSHPYLGAWINSSDFFPCVPSKYVLMCNKQWKRAQNRLNNNEVDEGGADFLPIFIGFAVCIIIIAALIIYIVRLRKKIGRLETQTNNERPINLISNEHT